MGHVSSGVGICRIPEDTCPIHAHLLLAGIAGGGECDRVTAIDGCKVAVYVNVVEQAHAVSLRVVIELLEIILDQRSAAVRLAIDGAAPWLIAWASAVAIIDILHGIEVCPPVINDRTADHGSGIDCFDGQGGS